MAKTNRKTLKEYFGRGKKPTNTQFADLIDSMLNIIDDGFNKSAERGLLLSPLDDNGAVMEVRRNILDEKPVWIVALGKNRELHIRREQEEEALITLCPDGRIVLSGAEKVRLEVSGSIQANSFTGNYLQGTAPANGQWHDIGGMDYGCIGYHIVAACGLKGKGRYGMADVTAMHCFGKHPRIWSHRSWFGSRFNKIQFRWHSNGLNCGLQVRTRSNYGEGVQVHYRVNNLFDMEFITQ